MFYLAKLCSLLNIQERFVIVNALKKNVAPSERFYLGNKCSLLNPKDTFECMVK